VWFFGLLVGKLKQQKIVKRIIYRANAPKSNSSFFFIQRRCPHAAPPVDGNICLGCSVAGPPLPIVGNCSSESNCQGAPVISMFCGLGLAGGGSSRRAMYWLRSIKSPMKSLEIDNLS
jgi:hypothetical protein